MIAKEILNKLSGRFDEAEVFVEHAKTEEFELRNSKDFSKGMNVDRGVGIRLIKDNKTAFVYSSLKNGDDTDDILYDALKAVKFSKSLEVPIFNNDVISSDRKKEIKIDETTIKDKIYFMDSIAKNFDKRIIDVKGSSFSVLTKEFEVANTYGVCAHDAKTHVSASVSVLAKDKTADMGWYDMDSDSFDGLDYKYIAQNAASMAINKLYPEEISTKKYSVIFENRVFLQILSHFFSIFDAHSVINHTTALENKLNDKVFSDCITIVDSKKLEGRPNCMEIDDEGAKRKDTIVVKNGVLKNFLHNVYTSNKLGLENTSNAKRASWINLPKVGAFNFHIEKNENMSKSSLLNKIDGVYISEIMGLHMANTISGDFSFGVDGFFVHNGELVSYFKSATLADNFFDMMSRIIDVSDNMYFSSSYGSPDVAVADCVIGGREL